MGWIVQTMLMRGRRGGPWDPPKALGGRPVSFEGNTGANLHGHWFPADRAHAQGTVVLVHPDRRYGGHWFVRDGWVPWLQHHGFDALTFDLTNYGRSRGPATYFHEDILAAIGHVRQRWGARPVHVIGLSIGAFAAINASPYMAGVDSLVLESPYPTFNAWYGGGAGALGMAIYDRAFPRTARAINAGANARGAQPGRILVAATRDDEVTRIALTRQVVGALPAERTRFVEVDGCGHLELFTQSDAYRAAVLETLDGGSASAAHASGGHEVAAATSLGSAAATGS